MPGPCVVSVAEHAGWAHVVCVAVTDSGPTVVERRRVSLIDAGLPTMPYHHESLGLPVDDANALIARVRESIAACAARALRDIVTTLAPAYSVVALAIREPTYPALPDSVVAVRESYPLQCAADGMMYQLALCRAARDLGLAVHQYRRGQPFADIKTRPPGPPWTEEHRRAYAAGAAALLSTRRAV